MLTLMHMMAHAQVVAYSTQLAFYIFINYVWVFTTVLEPHRSKFQPYAVDSCHKMSDSGAQLHIGANLNRSQTSTLVRRSPVKGRTQIRIRRQTAPEEER
ncbi:hypothetical protein EB796_010713 [Bugula neritina]|uniref:Uncharacterized protein n=1 Tax=Bugula neritina TaxID=10212 RepID=A0A7J7K071_BUGNE|nr:hypothetical protein EB796_010713 [Bugula neritina]